MSNDNVVLLDESMKVKINDVDKVREVIDAIIDVLMSKKHSMKKDKIMKLLLIGEMLCSWINTQNCDITDTVHDTLNILKSYNKSLTL
jgi:hypothetical protein